MLQERSYADRLHAGVKCVRGRAQRKHVSIHHLCNFVSMYVSGFSLAAGSVIPAVTQIFSLDQDGEPSTSAAASGSLRPNLAKGP